MTDTSSIEGNTTPVEDTIVQYIVLRADLKKWNLGALVAQGAHASAAAIWENRDDPDTISYCSPEHINTMHKVVLAANSEEDLRNLSSALSTSNIAHKLWLEQPENTPTCLAAKPYRRSFISPHFKQFRLLREMKKKC